MIAFIVRPALGPLLQIEAATASEACEIASDNGYFPMTAWQKEFTGYAMPSAQSRIDRGDFVIIGKGEPQ